MLNNAETLVGGTQSYPVSTHFGFIFSEIEDEVICVK